MLRVTTFIFLSLTPLSKNINVLSRWLTPFYLVWPQEDCLKFIFSEKATNFCKTPTVDLSYVVKVKSMVDILKIFVAFSEYMNFKPRQIWQYRHMLQLFEFISSWLTCLMKKMSSIIPISHQTSMLLLFLISLCYTLYLHLFSQTNSQITRQYCSEVWGQYKQQIQKIWQYIDSHFCDGLRNVQETPHFLKFCSALKKLLCLHIFSDIRRAGLKPSEIGDKIYGCFT